MSDFFGGLNASNMRFTDARINGDGPLPNNLSGPEGINGDPDGRYNFNESLLSGITPYAFGQGRMGADRNFQQIPHRKQFPVPPLCLPEAAVDSEACFTMSHPIDMGDLVFIISANYKSFFLSGNLHRVYKDAEDHTMPQFNAFCNVCTVNYILAGVSNYVLTEGERMIANAFNEEACQKHAWYNTLRCFDIDLGSINDVINNVPGTLTVDDKKLLLKLLLKTHLQRVVRDHIRPLGICATSEKQGGQHETGCQFLCDAHRRRPKPRSCEHMEKRGRRGRRVPDVAPGVVQTGQHALHAEPLLQRLDSKKHALCPGSVSAGAQRLQVQAQ